MEETTKTQPTTNYRYTSIDVRGLQRQLLAARTESEKLRLIGEITEALRPMIRSLARSLAPKLGRRFEVGEIENAAWLEVLLELHRLTGIRGADRKKGTQLKTIQGLPGYLRTVAYRKLLEIYFAKPGIDRHDVLRIRRARTELTNTGHSDASNREVVALANSRRPAKSKVLVTGDLAFADGALHADFNVELVASDAIEPDVEALRSAQHRHLADVAVRDLDPEELEAITLATVRGLPLKEVASMMNLPKRTLDTRLASAREKMRDSLAGAGYDATDLEL